MLKDIETFKKDMGLYSERKPLKVSEKSDYL